MAKNRVLIVKVTKTQLDKIKNDAIAKGYNTISGYVRSMLLENEALYFRRFDEIYQKIVMDESSTKNNLKIKERPLTVFIK